MPILSNSSQDKKNTYFDVRQLEVPKIAYPNGISFTCFFGYGRAENEDIGLKVCMRKFLIYSLPTNNLFKFWEGE